MFLYQKHNRYFAQFAAGLEEEGGRELAELGAAAVRPAFRGAHFEADREGLYRINHRSRLASRVLAPLMVFDCHSAKYLYKTARSIDWSAFLGESSTFAVRANVSQSAVAHSQYAALRLKDAVVDQFREKSGSRPSIDTIHPDLWLNLFIHRNRATVSVDTSGGSLHRRGYRHSSVEAPMQETVAAAVIRLSGWDGAAPLHDPMCGSGTLLAEALMHGGRIPAGYLRSAFGFQRLPDYDAGAWRRVREEGAGMMRALPAGTIRGSDISAEAVAASRSNLSGLPGGRDVEIRAAPFAAIEAIRDSVIVCNPPYGVRMGDRRAAAALVKEFGDFLKRRCTGSTAYVYFGERELIKSVGLRPAWKKPLRSGGLDGRLARYDLY
jgi:putative N6-adenine-specific DNA methylase